MRQIRVYQVRVELGGGGGWGWGNGGASICGFYENLTCVSLVTRGPEIE